MDSLALREREAGSFNFQVGLSCHVSLWVSREMMAISDAALVVADENSLARPTFLYYVVQSGDTLWKIARHYNTTVESIIQANKIADPDAVLTGEKILIPPCPVFKE